MFQVFEQGRQRAREGGGVVVDAPTTGRWQLGVVVEAPTQGRWQPTP